MSALALGLIAAFAWGFHDICVRYLSQRTPLMAALLTVSLAGTAFHLGMMVVQSDFHPMPREAVGWSVLAGVFFLVASLGLYGAFQRGPVRLVSPIIASYPVLSVGWAAMRGAEISLWQWGAVFAIILGVSIVAALSDDSTEDVPAKGPTIALSAIAAVGFAGTFALGQMAAEMSHDMPATLVTRLVLITLLVIGMAALRLPFWPGRGALAVLCLMGIADGIALMSVVSAAGLPDAQYAAVASSVFGLLTIVMAWAFLRERMTGIQWMGCAIAFAGIGYLAL